MHKFKILIGFLSFLITVYNSASAQSDKTLIRSHLKTLTKTPQFRNDSNIDQLNLTADFDIPRMAKVIDGVYSGLISLKP